MKKINTTKIIALFALFGIVIGIVGTGLLVIFSNNQYVETNVTLTPEQIQEFINAQSGATLGSGITLTTHTGENTGTGENK